MSLARLRLFTSSSYTFFQMASSDSPLPKWECPPMGDTPSAAYPLRMYNSMTRSKVPFMAGTAASRGRRR